MLLLTKGERMKKIINGKEIDVDVIGGFEIPDLDKKYILCSYDDDKSSEDALVMIYEIENIDGIENLVSIKDEENQSRRSGLRQHRPLHTAGLGGCSRL